MLRDFLIKGCQILSSFEFNICVCDVDETFAVKIVNLDGAQKTTVKCQYRSHVRCFENYVRHYGIHFKNVLWSFYHDEEDEEDEEDEDEDEDESGLEDVRGSEIEGDLEVDEDEEDEGDEEESELDENPRLEEPRDIIADQEQP